MNPDLQQLMIKARRSLDSANVLRARGDHDFAASRAYYAMFYVAEALLLSLNQSYSSPAATLGAYGREFAKTGRIDPKFHRWLLDAQDWRNTGDYVARIAITSDQSEELCHWAEEFIKAAEKYLSGGGGLKPDGEES